MACVAGLLVALRVGAGLLLALRNACVAGLLVALRDTGVAGLLVALRKTRAASESAGLLIALRLASVARVKASDASISCACVRVALRRAASICAAMIALRWIACLGADIARVVLGTGIRGTRQNRRSRTRRAEPNVEVEFIDRPRASGPDILDGCVPRDGDAGRLLAGNPRLARRRGLRVHHIREREFRIVIQLGGHIQALVAHPVALAGQSDQSHDFLRDLPRIRF
jgi:hypothetical protein